MKKGFSGLFILGLFISIVNAADVKELYVGSTTSLGKQYVIKCTNGSSIYEVHIRSNGYWYSGISNMGDDYKNLSINSVAQKYCSKY